MTLGNNTVYVPGGEALVRCGSATLNTSTWLARGYDRGTVVRGDVPSNETIAAWAAALLEMSS